MREFLAVTKAMSDESRVRILMFLVGGELCVCQIIEMLGLAPSTVSKHMSVLHQARLVESRKQGRWIHYRLAGPDAPPSAQDAIAWMRNSLARDPAVRQDGKRLRSVRKTSKEQLCTRYKS